MGKRGVGMDIVKIIMRLEDGKGVVKEYNDFWDYSIVEYKDGVKNGSTKEYSNNKLIFEGKYLNGKLNGKFKQYKSAGKLLIEGEYLNGKLNGNATEYDY